MVPRSLESPFISPVSYSLPQYPSLPEANKRQVLQNPPTWTSESRELELESAPRSYDDIPPLTMSPELRLSLPLAHSLLLLADALKHKRWGKPNTRPPALHARLGKNEALK